MTTADARAPGAARPPGTFKVGTIAGSDVLVSRSWFLIAALIALIVAPRGRAGARRVSAA